MKIEDKAVICSRSQGGRAYRRLQICCCDITSCQDSGSRYLRIWPCGYSFNVQKGQAAPQLISVHTADVSETIPGSPFEQRVMR